uniref:ATP synthase complex subunit 8 n=1 Tax=Solenosthedium bilunatum TaxID=2080405 RepID=A0A2P1CLU0_9HEMI|nr:ATP synthase F0 subunit 8 [Solenosthedium bilunatum]
MPQMAPLSWEILFLTFIASMMIMSTIIYHTPKIKSYKKEESPVKVKSLDWKW